jgi:hypothetical protein
LFLSETAKALTADMAEKIVKEPWRNILAMFASKWFSGFTDE